MVALLIVLQIVGPSPFPFQRLYPTGYRKQTHYIIIDSLIATRITQKPGIYTHQHASFSSLLVSSGKHGGRSSSWLSEEERIGASVVQSSKKSDSLKSQVGSRLLTSVKKVQRPFSIPGSLLAFCHIFGLIMLRILQGRKWKHRNGT